MPIIKSAVKRMKQTTKRRERNASIKKDIKSALKTFMAEPTAETASKVQSEYDKAVKKGLLKKATVSRRKARIARIAKEAGVTAKAAPAKKPATKKPAAKKPAAKKPAAKKTIAKKTDK